MTLHHFYLELLFIKTLFIKYIIHKNVDKYFKLLKLVSKWTEVFLKYLLWWNNDDLLLYDHLQWYKLSRTPYTIRNVCARINIIKSFCMAKTPL